MCRRERLRRRNRFRNNAAPELVAAVEQGHLAVRVAAKAASLPVEDQQEIAEKAKAGEANAARKVVKQNARQQKEQKLASKQAALSAKARDHRDVDGIGLGDLRQRLASSAALERFLALEVG